MHAARQVLFHLGVLTEPPPNLHRQLRQSFELRMAPVADALRPSFVAYLERLVATHAPGTITSTATRLAHLAATWPPPGGRGPRPRLPRLPRPTTAHRAL